MFKPFLNVYEMLNNNIMRMYGEGGRVRGQLMCPILFSPRVLHNIT